MVVGLLLAGGVGERMGAKIPKQFLQVNNKPIIYYPLSMMEKCTDIDLVEIVCVEDYIDTMWSIVQKYTFSKVKWIVSGGKSCQESTFFGLKYLNDILNGNDIILIHMSSYPLVTSMMMSECINSVRKNGNGCTARPVLYSCFLTDDKHTSNKAIDRDKIMLCTIPYAFNYIECVELHKKKYHEKSNNSNNVFTNTLFCEYGKRIYFTKDSSYNIKVTTPEDVNLMKAVLSVMNMNW